MNPFLAAGLSVILSLSASCEKTPDTAGGNDDNDTIPARVTDVQKTPTIGKDDNGFRLAWDYSTEKKLMDRGGYARILRLQDGSYILATEDHSSNVVVRKSKDGVQWDNKIIVFSPSQEGGVSANACNAEVFQMSDGTLICGANYRPVSEGKASWSIAVSRSFDNGEHWEEPKIIYRAGMKGADGCWEPCFLQLPSGELQVYFANEGPYTTSSEQEISMLRSYNKGTTWSTSATKVSFRAGKRDGMPVPRIVEDEIVVAIEDNKVGEFKPYTVRCKISDNWSSYVSADSKNREYALADTEIPTSAYLGAPYLLVLPGGKTLLSYQTTVDRNSNWELSCMEVAVGDETARNFEILSRPFNVGNDREGKWNSLAIWDENSVVAVSSTNKDGAAVAPWMKVGHVMDKIRVSASSLQDKKFFVGSKGITRAFAGISVSGGKMKISSDVYDNDISDKDGIWFYIDPINNSYGGPYAGIFKIWASRSGEVTVWEGNNGTWQEIDPALVNVKAGKMSSEDGYVIDAELDASVFAPGKTFRFALGLAAYSAGGSGYNEMLDRALDTKPCSWMRVNID
ncbi:MAG: exo-alpha-sialidase [Bacteroidales bacterium]|nr:exo-alpha-sialidase [Bacteroidales bacterium]